jgi:hypothetical protein
MQPATTIGLDIEADWTCREKLRVLGRAEKGSPLLFWIKAALSSVMLA